MYSSFKLIYFIAFQIFLLVFIVIFNQSNFFQPVSLVYPYCCFILGLVIWFFTSWRFLTNQAFHPYIIFLISAILFNGGQAILEVFHLNQNGLLKSHFSDETLVRTLFFTSICFSAFHLGALLSLGAVNIAHSLKKPQLSYIQSKRRRLNKRATDEIPLTTEKYSRGQLEQDTPLDTTKGSAIVGWALTSISFLPSIYVFFQSLKVVITSGYQGLYQGDQETSVAAAPAVLATFVIPAVMFLLAGSQPPNRPPKKRTQIFAVVLMVLYILSNIVIGQRRNVATRLVAFTWLWHTWVRKIPGSLIVIGGLSLTILFPIIAATRNMVGADRTSFLTVLTSLLGSKNPVFLTLNEMGGSMMTVAYTIELIPSTRPFQMGADYFYAFFTLVPNLFWKIHPTIARGLAGTWLTWQIDPEFASRGGGYGFSFIAEAFMNFGWVGGPITLGVFGFFFTLVTLWAVNSSSAARMAMIGTFTAFLPFYARSELALHVRALVWYAVIPYAAAVYLSRNSENNLRPRLKRRFP
ncbi:MAG TPA: O-antigen polysaccharide polymerase Wzy [Stenomitos sp.]